jgi:alkylation response protein AidB-like acyl-CoA dehydrogenase
VDFNFTETQIELKNTILQFARKELNSRPPEKNGIDNFPLNDWQKCAEMGLMSLPLSQKYGGLEADLLTSTIAIEALAYGCRDNGFVFSIVTQLLSGIMLDHFGNDTQKEKYLADICNGKIIAAQAITEPDAGSDAMGMKTRAKKKDGNYLLNGSKIFISNGPIADLAGVFVIGDSDKQKFTRISCFLIEKDTPGFTRARPMEKMGLQTLQNGELIFDDCLIPEENLLGKEGQGAMILNEILLFERILFSACHVGVMQRVIEECIEYASQREQFGQHIGKFQAVSHKIADMKTELELSKLILYKSAWQKDQNKRPHIETSMSKLFISESLKKICLDALQIHGSYGYMKEFNIERELRDSIAGTIYSGTSEIHRNIIATLLGL